MTGVGFPVVFRIFPGNLRPDLADRLLIFYEEKKKQRRREESGRSGERLGGGTPAEFGANMIEETDCKRRREAVLAILTEGLPPISSRLCQLAAMLAASPVDLKQVASLIRGDRHLTSKLFRWSEALGPGQRRVRSVEEAAVLLGTQRLRNLILADCLMALAGNRIDEADVEKFWAHSLATAVLGESIARTVGYDDSERAYLGGVIHDWGKIPLLMAATGESETLLGSTRHNADALEFERRRFGFDHCQVGRSLGIAWKIDSGLIEVLECHHQPEKARFDPALVGIVAAADHFLDSAAHAASQWVIDDVYRACFPSLGEEELADLVSLLAREYSRMELRGQLRAQQSSSFPAVGTGRTNE